VTSSISRRLIFWLAVPLMLLALCGALVHYFNSVAPGVISSDKRLKEAANALMAHVIVKNGQVILDTGAGADTGPGRRPPMPAADSIHYALHDSLGRLFAGDPHLAFVPMGSETTQLFAMAQIDHRSLRTLTTRFDTRAGVIFITAADVRPATEPAARYGFMSTLLWDFVQLDLTLVLVWVGIQLGLRPVKKLRDEIAERSPQDLRPIVESTIPREIVPVVVTLNRLFTTLRTSVQSQQQFIANTAHQLRTPITGIQAQLDLLLAEPAAQPVKSRLLTLQEGIRQLAHSATIVAEVVARFFDRALQSNIDLGAEVSPVSILADPSLLDDLLTNLVDNALKYTPAGGTVTVSTGKKNGRPFLAVEDTGLGIPESKRQHVRQRFYRVPNSPGHGSGLGLAIVDGIARLYDASMIIGPGANGRGTRVFVQFPESSIARG